jgi:regulator of sigma E protease
MSILYIFYALLLLGILIAVHEFGHFITARRTGIAVKEFSIGFGPKFLQWKSKKHDTLFSLRSIPMGGYCMYYGDTEDDQKREDDPRSYSRAPVWKRMLSVFCGPLMNFVLAFVVAVALIAGYEGIPTQPYIQQVEAGMPADMAGLEEGDIILRIGGQDLVSVLDMSSAIDAGGEKGIISITVLREGQEVSLALSPIHDPVENRYRIGITINDSKPLPLSQVIPTAWSGCVKASGLILYSLGRLATTGEGLDDTAGPVGMIQQIAEQTRQGGFAVFLNLVVILSINLGLLNLIPIPGLDGSRLVFMIIEAIRRKPVSRRIEAGIHMAGLAFLLGLIVFFTFKDIGRIIGIK